MAERIRGNAKKKAAKKGVSSKAKVVKPAVRRAAAATRPAAKRGGKAVKATKPAKRGAKDVKAAAKAAVKRGGKAVKPAAKAAVKRGAKAVVKRGAKATKPAVKRAAKAAKPVLKRGAKAAKPVLKRGAKAAKPVLKRGAKAAKPALKRGAKAAKPALKRGAKAAKPASKRGAKTTKPAVKRMANATKPVAKRAPKASKPIARPAAKTVKPTATRAPAAPRYPFVAVDVREAYSGEIAALLFQNGASGVEERDDSTLRKGPGQGTVTVVGSFPSLAVAQAAVKAVRVSRPMLKPRIEEVVGDDWRDVWKEHFAPFALTQRVRVAPPWAVPAPREGERMLVLEPGRAFGTGLHASTALVAALLDERAASFAGQVVLDVGTGSGILALAAIALGAAGVVALDIDPTAVTVTRENAQRNAMGDRVVARVGSAGNAGGRYPFVLANIEARILGPMAEELAAAVAPGGTLILSGILASEHDAMVKLYGELGFVHTQTARRGEAAGEAWVAIAMTGPMR